MDLYKKITAFENELEKWGRREEVYWMGVKICEKHMPNTRLLRLLTRAKKPNAKHWGHLEYQLKKLKPAKKMLTSAVPIKAPPEPQPEKTSPIEVDLKPDALEEITSKIRQLATERALLSNQLVDPGDDAVLIENNCKILERIEPVMEQIKELEKKREGIKTGKISPEEDTEQGRRTVVMRAGEEYTLNDLYKMSGNEILDLKYRLIDDTTKAKVRMKRNKTEKSRKNNEEKLKKLELMKIIVNKVILERKALEITE